MRRATAIPSPTSTTPAFSPNPASTHGAVNGRRPRWTRDDLYEQCSDHMTAYMASSRSLAGRPRRRVMASASSSVRPSSRWRASGMQATYRRTVQSRIDLISPFHPVRIRQMPAKTASPKSMPAKTKRSRSPMSDSHKAALAEGRDQGRAVRRYLEALEAHKPKRGRKRTPESVQKRLTAIEERLADADALTRLHLMQERMNLTNELASSDDSVDMQAIEDEFVAAAGPYGARKGITYAAWRSMGVDPSVLRRANIKRGEG